MRSNPPRRRSVAWIAMSLAQVALVLALVSAPQIGAWAAGAPAQSFDSPDAAVAALRQAVDAKDEAALLAIFGAGAANLVSSGDKVEDEAAMGRFGDRLKQYTRIDQDTDDHAVLYIGTENWPFPIPMVRTGTTWSFDTEAGQEEIIDRRVGANELDAIEVVRAYVTAQREYATTDRNGDEVLDFAKRFISTPGKHDGLYWKSVSDVDLSPLGPQVVAATAEGYGKTDVSTKGPQPYHGYLYKILTRQGPDAPGGAYDYIINGHMIGGFALVAYPATWGASGVMSFIVNQQGKVYQKNLGKKTAAFAGGMTTYNPDSTWELVKD